MRGRQLFSYLVTFVVATICKTLGKLSKAFVFKPFMIRPLNVTIHVILNVHQ